MVEIDRLGDPNNADNNDTFRWSVDGGVSFVQEYVEIVAGSAYSLAFGLDANFTASTGHGLGDRWIFYDRPQNQIVQIASGASAGANIKRTRDNLKHAIDYAQNQGILSLRTYIDSNDSLLHLAHTFDYAVVSDVNITGSALTTSTPTPGSIILLTMPMGMGWQIISSSPRQRMVRRISPLESPGRPMRPETLSSLRLRKILTVPGLPAHLPLSR